MKAKERGLEHAFVCDIQALELPEGFYDPDIKFDAVFSNAALHWCKRDPAGVLESAKKVLKPGGRLVVEMGGFMNCIGQRRFIFTLPSFLIVLLGIRSALHHALRSRGHDPIPLDPWYYPSIDDYVNVSSLLFVYAMSGLPCV